MPFIAASTCSTSALSSIKPSAVFISSVISVAFNALSLANIKASMCGIISEISIKQMGKKANVQICKI